MSASFWAGIALCTLAAGLFLVERRLLIRHNRERVPLQCPECREIYAIVRWEQVGPAVALHSEFECRFAEERYYG